MERLHPTQEQSLEEAVLSDRLNQFQRGPQEIALVHSIREQFNGTYYFDEVRDGKKETREVDAQVEQAMKGAMYGIHNELRSSGVIFEAGVPKQLP